MMESTLSRIACTVESRLDVLFEQARTRSLSEVFATRISSVVLDQVHSLTLRGGKRLRPALLIHGAALFDEAQAGAPAVVDACAALELLHTYFLIHDDIMDGDDTRRGGPSVHSALGEICGDRHQGMSLAILAGDLAAALHESLIANLDVEPNIRRRVANLFAAMHLEVIHGQTLDLLGGSPPEEIAAKKTASYTTVGPLAVGATLANAPEPEVKKLAAIGAALGIAFQLRDDMIGVWGGSEVTGKPKGADLRNGKRTFLIGEGLRLADPGQKRTIEAVLGRRDAGDVEVAKACETLVRCGALESCRNRIDALIRVFVQGLENDAYSESGRRFLVEVARYIGSREK